MQLKFLVVVCFLCLIGWFFVQNKELTSYVRFFFGKPVEVPSIIVITVSCLVGILLTVIFGMVDQIRLRKIIKEKTKEIESLKERLGHLKERKEDEFSK
jgi:uncharacterized integral membrane protein